MCLILSSLYFIMLPLSDSVSEALYFLVSDWLFRGLGFTLLVTTLLVPLLPASGTIYLQQLAPLQQSSASGNIQRPRPTF